jgi:thioredoxin reductase (NADPH)
MFIGAVPNTDWLRRCAVGVDDEGFVATGESPDRCTATHAGGERAALSLETTLHGVFAVGDVRAGSVKRVSAAVGEGAAVAPQLHAYLRELTAGAP